MIKGTFLEKDSGNQNEVKFKLAQKLEELIGLFDEGSLCNRSHLLAQPFTPDCIRRYRN